ncbi:hypothetical protein OAE26_00105 [Synechococcus sp. AH-551-E05]|nr:hypothetical protein [Synechococcus sp. AH-551-E05]MDB4650969.1 hypothetical protein [Synechococcus sp. AH-551-E05]
MIEYGNRLMHLRQSQVSISKSGKIKSKLNISNLFELSEECEQENLHRFIDLLVAQGPLDSNYLHTMSNTLFYPDKLSGKLSQRIISDMSHEMCLPQSNSCRSVYYYDCENMLKSGADIINSLIHPSLSSMYLQTSLNVSNNKPTILARDMPDVVQKLQKLCPLEFRIYEQAQASLMS